MESLLIQILDKTERHKEENENHMLLYHLPFALCRWTPSLFGTFSLFVYIYAIRLMLYVLFPKLHFFHIRYLEHISMLIYKCTLFNFLPNTIKVI